MSNINNLEYWNNSSQPHYGVPNSRVVIPLVRTNGQPGDIPGGFKIPSCFLESNTLYQSAPLVAISGTTAFVPIAELYVPAGRLLGGERIRANVAFSAPITPSSVDTVTLRIQVANAGAIVTEGPVTILTMTVPVATAVKLANAELDMYYNVLTGQLNVFATTRSDATYASGVLAPLAFSNTADQRIQIGIVQSSTAQNEVITFTYASIGLVN